MSQFLTGLSVRLVSIPAGGGRGLWELTSPLMYQSDVAGATIAVPRGFHTDFASVPRIPIAYMLAGNTAHDAAVVHDYLYTTGEFPRDVADKVFLEAMGVAGIPAWRRYAMYYAVRAFGGSHCSGGK